MCILSVFTPGAVVDRTHLANGACWNPDGHGYAIAARDRILTGHGMNADAVLDAFVAARETHPDGWALFHSRITTDGETNEANCHPFIVGGDPRTVLAHNGVLPDEARPAKGETRSDTRLLAEVLIPSGRFGAIHTRKAQRRLERWATRRYMNKIALLTVDPRYKESCVILGERFGVWDDGVWHSNSDYLRPGDFDAQELALFRAYCNGRITWDQYRAQVAELEVTPAQTGSKIECWSCPDGAIGPDGFCEGCGACGDCGDWRSHCLCYRPASLGDIPTGDLGHTPMALEGGGDKP